MALESLQWVGSSQSSAGRAQARSLELPGSNSPALVTLTLAIYLLLASSKIDPGPLALTCWHVMEKSIERYVNDPRAILQIGLGDHLDP